MIGKSLFRIALALGIGSVALSPMAVSAQKKDRNRISRAELLQSAQRSQDLYRAILSLRPQFIAPLALRTSAAARSQGASTPKPVVYIDGNLSGDLDVLRSILTQDVEEVRYLSPIEAGLELGSDAAGGAIMVKLRAYSKKP